MQLASGRQFWPLDPCPEEIFIEDIAAGLSRACRYGGHLRDDVEFYSVAEHSVHMAHYAARTMGSQMAFAALMHDASEGYLNDMIRPIKPSIPQYGVVERRLEAVIARRFGLTDPMPPAVKALDNRICNDELDQAMAQPVVGWRTEGGPLGVTLHFWSPFRARAEFLAAFEAYRGEAT